MSDSGSFSDSTCEEHVRLAERELACFFAAATKLYGPEQARLSAEDWLEEWDLADCPPRAKVRDWRAITIAASARLANRLGIKAALAEAHDIYTLV